MALLYTKDKFYYGNGTPFHGIFKEIPMSGAQNVPADPMDPLYTIDTEDGDLPSAHKIYMESLNEYDAALKLVPSWPFWRQMLKTSVKIRRLISDWREEKLLKDQAAARAMLWEQAQKGNVSAQRILYESKKEEAEQRRKEKETKSIEAKEQSVLEARLERLTNLKAVK